MLRQDGVDHLALVVDADVGVVEELAQAGVAVLDLVEARVDGAEEEGSQPALAAELQEVPREGQGNDGVLHLAEALVKPALQLRQRHVRDMALIEGTEGQLKLGTEPVQRHLGDTGHAEDVVRRVPHGGEVVHQRPGPVEDDVANHGATVSREPRLSKSDQGPARGAG